MQRRRDIKSQIATQFIIYHRYTYIRYNSILVVLILRGRRGRLVCFSGAVEKSSSTPAKSHATARLFNRRSEMSSKSAARGRHLRMHTSVIEAIRFSSSITTIPRDHSVLSGKFADTPYFFVPSINSISACKEKSVDFSNLSRSSTSSSFEASMITLAHPDKTNGSASS